MNDELRRNPFARTKASHFTDEEISQWWIDFPVAGGYQSIAEPASLVPKVFLGGKGSGKTHLMRHMSFEVQKIRWRDKLIYGLRDEGYLGIYVKCSGLNAHRFEGKGQAEE